MLASINLREALARELRARVDCDVEECYAVFDHPSDLKNGKWYVAINADATKEFRKVDLRDVTMDIAYQIALPDATKEYPKPVANLPFLNTAMERVDKVRSLFSQDGEYRDESIADHIAIETFDMPPYLPSNLLEHGLFTSVIRVRFRYEK